jgi:hypothetical protein
MNSRDTAVSFIWYYIFMYCGLQKLVRQFLDYCLL